MSKTLKTYAVIVFWLSCGLLSSGYEYAYAVRTRSEYMSAFKIRRQAKTVVMFGPVALFTTLFVGNDEFGWLNPWTEPKKEQP